MPGTISWTNELLTGNAFIDEDHRQLADRVNVLLHALSTKQGIEVIDAALNHLIADTRAHFEREEAEMQRIRFVGTPAHSSDHARLLAEITGLKTRLDGGEKISAVAVFTFLNAWLRHHVLEVDVKLTAAMKHAA